MTRVRVFNPGVDVYEAAKARIHHIYDLHDTVVVMFSGGKDSLALLHMVREVALERGIEHVDVVFRDEELIPDPVIAFVDHYRQLPWVRMRYYAVPLASTQFVLGESTRYVQWDPKRAHIRPIPAHALTLPEGDERVFDQYTMDAYIAQAYKGKIAFLTGVRAQESLIRLRASLNKLNDNYINGSKSMNVSLCKPLYDWSEDDVLLYFYREGIRYCEIYDAQHLAGMNLRVSTPLHAEAAKRFGQLRAIAPMFYQQVVDLFPQMLLQERYYAELDKGRLKALYAHSLEGIREYIDETIADPAQHSLALKRLEKATISHRNDPDAYPLPHIFTYFTGGSFKRQILPLSSKEKARHYAIRMAKQKDAHAATAH